MGALPIKISTQFVYKLSSTSNRFVFVAVFRCGMVRGVILNNRAPKNLKKFFG